MLRKMYKREGRAFATMLEGLNDKAPRLALSRGASLPHHALSRHARTGRVIARWLVAPFPAHSGSRFGDVPVENHALCRGKHCVDARRLARSTGTTAATSHCAEVACDFARTARESWCELIL